MLLAINNKTMGTTNWSEKSTDEIYEFYRNIKDDKEAIDFLLNLLANHPQLELAWIDMLADSMYAVLNQGEINDVVAFVELYRQKFPDDYRHEYGFVEKELISHYLYRNDIENVKKRLEIIKQTPVAGFDDVTKKALFQLIYHGHYQLVYEYSLAVWKPLFETEELTGSPHFYFSSTIYLHELEGIYMLIKNGGVPDIKSFKERMDGFDLDEEYSMYKTVFDNLAHPLDADTIARKLRDKDREAVLMLNIQFLKYMKENYDIPFMLSDRMWNMLSVMDLFGSEDAPDGFFYVPYIELKEHFLNHTDTFFIGDDVEMFGKVWGLDYAYAFLHKSGFISEHYFSLMEENIQALKNFYIKQIYTSLWQMNFVFSWPMLYVPDPYEQQLFNETYHETDENIRKKLDNYIAMTPENKRITQELRKASKQQDETPDYLNSLYESYQREEPKIGRNDPCLCGSGKKYKKCCMDK